MYMNIQKPSEFYPHKRERILVHIHRLHQYLINQCVLHIDGTTEDTIAAHNIHRKYVRGSPQVGTLCLVLCDLYPFIPSYTIDKSFVHFLFQMHNGCICCTLRGDLLKTVKSLGSQGDFDYLVIESTGISEPLPVAQTFAMDVDSMQPKEYDVSTTGTDSNPSEGELTVVAADERKSLFHYAKLDTLVTVVDALNIYDLLASGKIYVLKIKSIII